MSIVESPSGVPLEVESSKAARSVVVPRGAGYAISAVTGAMAAAQQGAIFVMRRSASAPKPAYIDRIRLQWTTIVAFSAALTAGRRIALYRCSGTDAGGTQVLSAAKKDTGLGASYFDNSAGGSIRMATTGVLTGLTIGTAPIAQMTLSHLGAAGATGEVVWEFAASESCELLLRPGEGMVISTGQAMDAAGTWQLAASVQWREADLLV